MVLYSVTAEEEPWSFIVLADWHNAEPFARKPGNGTDPWNKLYDQIHYVKETYGGDLVVLPGDSNNGKWDTKEFAIKFESELEVRDRILQAGRNCYGTTKKLFKEAGYEHMLMAVGDHELGGNRWAPGSVKSDSLDVFRQGLYEGFNEEPTTGLFLFNKAIGSAPSRPMKTQFRQTSFAYQHKNVLFITLDAFLKLADNFMDRELGLGGEGAMSCTVEGEHLIWFEHVLQEAKKDQTIKHIIVQAHLPIIQPVRKINCSGQFMDRGEESALWKTMVKYEVDIYLAGEVHTNTVTKDPESNLLQIVSRGNSFNNFLKIEVTHGALKVTSYNEIGPKAKNNQNYEAYGSLVLNKDVLCHTLGDQGVAKPVVSSNKNKNKAVRKSRTLDTTQGMALIACGASSSTCGNDPPKEVSRDALYPVSCCSNTYFHSPSTQKNKDDVRCPYAATCLKKRTFKEISGGFTKKSCNNGLCSGKVTYRRAKKICSIAGANICTLNDLARDCALFTGCNYIKTFVWARPNPITEFPSTSPSTSHIPSTLPSHSASNIPTISPLPSAMPSALPSNAPSSSPSSSPSVLPSASPSDIPSHSPSFLPSSVPSVTLTHLPSNIPTTSPSNLPSNIPTASPSDIPSLSPSSLPSALPSATLAQVACGAGSSATCADKPPKFVERDARYPVRCCSDTYFQSPSTQKNKDDVKCPYAATCLKKRTFKKLSLPGFSKDSCLGGYCSGKVTYRQANNICSFIGGYICTLDDLVRDCALSTGCNYDKTFVWAGLDPITEFPSTSPSTSHIPSTLPSHSPSNIPTISPLPSAMPSVLPSNAPSSSRLPTVTPSVSPSKQPSVIPSVSPSGIPSISFSPSALPSLSPSRLPSVTPSVSPSSIPSSSPSRLPSVRPSISAKPSISTEPTMFPRCTVITSSGVLELLNRTSALIHLDFGKTIPLTQRQIVGMHHDYEKDTLVASLITIRGKKSKNSLPNQGSFGQPYDAQVANLRLKQKQSSSYAVLSRTSRIGIYGFGPHSGGSTISYSLLISTTSNSEVILVHYGHAFTENSTKNMYTLTLKKGTPNLYISPTAILEPVKRKLNLNDGNWHHIAVSMPTKSCKLSDVIMYVDGKVIETTTETETNIFFTTTGRLSIGGFGYSHISHEDIFPHLSPYVGKLDEFYMWGRAIEDNDIILAMEEMQ